MVKDWKCSLIPMQALCVRHLQYEISCEVRTASDERAGPGNEAIGNEG